MEFPNLEKNHSQSIRFGCSGVPCGRRMLQSQQRRVTLSDQLRIESTRDTPFACSRSRSEAKTEVSSSSARCGTDLISEVECSASLFPRLIGRCRFSLKPTHWLLGNPWPLWTCTWMPLLCPLAEACFMFDRRTDLGIFGPSGQTLGHQTSQISHLGVSFQETHGNPQSCAPRDHSFDVVPGNSAGSSQGQTSVKAKVSPSLRPCCPSGQFRWTSDYVEWLCHHPHQTVSKNSQNCPLKVFEYVLRHSKTISNLSALLGRWQSSSLLFNLLALSGQLRLQQAHISTCQRSVV